MRKFLTCAAVTMFLCTACKKEQQVVTEKTGEIKADWTSDNSSSNYTSKTYSPYTVFNNVWGENPGYQSIWANNGNNWGIWSNHPNTSGIKSYPNSERKVQRSLSSLNSLTSYYNITVPSDGSWGADYDVWTSNDKYEIMLWMNYRGSVGPIASSYPGGVAQINVSNKTVGGHTWNVYKGPVGSGGKQVFSFLRTSNSTSGNVNIKDIMNYLKNDLGWIGNEMIDRVQFGFEVTSTSGGRNHSVNNYTVSFN
jgi:hypothetical protein